MAKSISLIFDLNSSRHSIGCFGSAPDKNVKHNVKIEVAGLGLHIAELPDLVSKTASKVNLKHRGIVYKFVI